MSVEKIGPDHGDGSLGLDKSSSDASTNSKTGDDDEEKSTQYKKSLERYQAGEESGEVLNFIEQYKNEIKPGDHVLEVGTGYGRNLWRFGQELGATVHGVEYDKDTADLARKIMAEKGIPADIKEGSFTDLSFYEDGTMKIVLSHSSIQNARTMAEAEKAVSEITRVLAKDGLFLFRENNTPRLQDADRKNRVAYFTKEEVTKLASDHNLVIEQNPEPIEGDDDIERVGGKKVAWSIVFRKRE